MAQAQAQRCEKAAAAVHAGDIALVLRAADYAPDDAIAAARSARAASRVAVDVAEATTPGAITGIALEHARGMIEAALVTLDRLGDHGWATVAGAAPPTVAPPGALARACRFCDRRWRCGAVSPSVPGYDPATCRRRGGLPAFRG